MQQEIFIERKLPIINGFVSIPDGQISLRSATTPTAAEGVVTGSSTVMAYGDAAPSGLQAQSGLGTNRQWFVLPQFNSRTGDSADHYKDLRDDAVL